MSVVNYVWEGASKRVDVSKTIPCIHSRPAPGCEILRLCGKETTLDYGKNGESKRRPITCMAITYMNGGENCPLNRK